MTNRERFHKVMDYRKDIDRSPVIEWAPWWDQTLLEWEAAGMPGNMDEEELRDYFQLDKITQFWFPHRTQECQAEKHHGAGLLENVKDYDALRPFILPGDAVERMKGLIDRTLPSYEKGETIVWYTINGFFWHPRELFGIENHLFSFYDEPELYHRICDDLAEWQIQVIHRFGQYMKADFMTFAEDMSYNNGPMISKDMFDEFIKPYYERVIPEIKKYGTKVFIDSDGDISKAVPWFLDAGADGVLPLEKQAGVDLAQYRKDYPKLLMLGGFDKMCMFQGKEAIKKEVERLLPIIRSGGYLPGMDHQTPPGVTMENYRYYVSLMREASAFACQDC